jgi:hypothetical protein
MSRATPLLHLCFIHGMSKGFFFFFLLLLSSSFSSFFLLLISSFLLLLLLLALQFVVNLSLLQNCPPLFSILLLTSPVPHAHLLQIFNWLKSPQLRFPFTSSIFSGLRKVLLTNLPYSLVLTGSSQGYIYAWTDLSKPVIIPIKHVAG